VLRQLATLSAVSLSALLGPLALAAALWGMWAWSGTSGALSTALKLASWALPFGQTLHTSDIQGNLRQGGHLGLLRWEHQGLRIESRDTQLVLDWSLLWRQPWPVQSIHLKALDVDDQRPAKPLTPLDSLTLPLPVQMTVRIDQMRWTGSTPFELSDVQAHYAYDGQQHSLDVYSLVLAQSHYKAQARMQGAAPMALHIDVQGQVLSPPMGPTPALTLDLTAAIDGSLSGPQAQLAVQAQLAPASEHSAGARLANAERLALTAQIQPWQAQPVVQGQGQWQNLNLAPLWPGAPQTRLTGNALMKAEGKAWRLEAQARNLQPGPWDQKSLPLSQWNLTALYKDHRWQDLQGQAELAGGRVEGQGQQTPQGWAGELKLSAVVPAQLHSEWPSTTVQGQMQAQVTDAEHINWRAELQAQNPASNFKSSAKSTSQNSPHPVDQLNWQGLQVQGQYLRHTWNIEQLQIDAAQARLEAQFNWDAPQKAAKGRWSIKVPGLQAQAQGTLAPQSGLGQMEITLSDAALAVAWLNKLPFEIPFLQGMQATGSGQLQARWEGGYAQADAPFNVNASWPTLSWQTEGQRALQLTQGQIQVQGNPKALQAQLQTRLTQGSQSANLQTRLKAQRPDEQSPRWQGQIEQVQLELTTPDQPLPWRLNLQQTMGWQGQWGEAPSWQWDASTWQLQGPLPGTARVQSDAGRWRVPAAGQPAQVQWSGRLTEVPLNWAMPWLAGDIQHDVVLQGQWQVKRDQAWQASASVQRSRGDFRIQTDAISRQKLPAGLREARLNLSLEADTLLADLRWESQHMGQATAQLETRLSQTPQGWGWSEQAPLRGWVQASLPQVGVWSVLAPPGWRVQGTMDARLDLSGTRARPEWWGRIQADNLALRSAVQGIELGQGQLRAQLQGQELILERLILRGAGAQGGQVQAKGQIKLPALSGQTLAPGSSPLAAAELNVQIQAEGLRLSNRADRRLAVSGDLSAQIKQGPLRLRGLVKADQALFILPDDSTPSLGNDVHVVRPRPALEIPLPPAPNSPSAAASWLGTPDVQVQLDLGRDFVLRGQGIDTHLQGRVLVTSNTATQGLPRLSGEVRTAGGRYKAYGQQLRIESGVLRFNGPYDNPVLDIIALRPNLPQNVGVQVSGTALQPRIRLYADPDLPDADKLAWLVLGRSAAGGGAESAVLQQAALVLLSGDGKSLSGELANRLGLDEISLATGSRSDATATGAAITLGKRLSDDFYLAYETSLSGTFGSLYIFYDLTRRLTLRAQTGEQSALDLIFTIRRD
jgi:translocation and assembly module TamB